MKRKYIFLIAFISIICIIGAIVLWYRNSDAKRKEAELARKHVVLIGEKIDKITYENGLLSFLDNNPKYCVWYVLTSKSVAASHKHAIAVDDITDKEKVINGIKALAKQGLVLDNIAHMLIFTKTKEAFALQKDLHKEFNVKEGCSQETMERILAQYQRKGTHGQHEVHLVLKDGEKIVAKAVAYTTSTHKEHSISYESYIELNDTDKGTALIASAMAFAKAKQYANGGLTVYFDSQDKIKGIQPFSRLFPKLSYRNIFMSYSPTPQEAYQARLYCNIQPHGGFEEGNECQLVPQRIREQCPTSLKSISLLKDNETKMVDNIALDSVHVVAVGEQVVLYLQNKSRDTLAANIEAAKKAYPISFWATTS